MDSLRRGANIIIATPGRLIDFMDQGVIDFKGLTHLVLDEADRMLDMGFLPSIKRIAKVIPAKRQTLFFSATMSPEIEHIAYAMLKDPTFIEVSKRGSAATLVEQTAYPVAQQSKMTLLARSARQREIRPRACIYTHKTRRRPYRPHFGETRSHKSNRIHGDRSQSQREAALRSFKSGHTNVLVATDVAARGIDIDSVSHVINYDIPEAPEDYVHRIGRTGRAGKNGRAITLFTVAEEHSMRAIEKLTGQRVERVVLPDFGGHTFAASAPKKVGGRAGRTYRSFAPRRGR